MQVTKQELMNKLGVGRVLGPYENCPWMVCDEEGSVTCNAEVSAGTDNMDDIYAAVDVMYETPPEGKPPADHVFQLCAYHSNAGNWTIRKVSVRGEALDETISNWPEKSCNFFGAVVQSLKQGIIPDIDELLDQELFKKERGADQYGGGGKKAPKIEANQLLTPKGRGF